MKLFEQEFYDYKTQSVESGRVIDTRKTGMSYYDDFLKDQKTINYLRDEKNLKGTIVNMSPEEYYEACSKFIFTHRAVTVNDLKMQRSADKDTIKHLKDVLTIYKKRFPLPILNKAEQSQEGLHRMMAIGELFGWDYEVPVLVVEWADIDRAKKAAEDKRTDRIRNKIRLAVKDALNFTYYSVEELEEQLGWELDRQFDYDEEVQTPVEFELTTSKEKYHIPVEDQFIVTVSGVSYEFDAEDVKFEEKSEDVDEEELDFDDIDFDDLDIDLNI